MLSKIYQKKGLALFLIVNLQGVLEPYLGLDLIDPSLVDTIESIDSIFCRFSHLNLVISSSINLKNSNGSQWFVTKC